MTEHETSPLVHVRTPTYRRPEALGRCLESLQMQSHTNWVCDVFDDDPKGSARAIVEGMNDPRITFVQNAPQRFASKNIDQCFARANPRQADYFCVVEDDNFVLPNFMADNIACCEQHDVEIVLRNQLIEYASGTRSAELSAAGILDRKLVEMRYDPDLFRMTLLSDIGVSNGGLFWSRKARSDLEIHYDCSATLQEYMRTFAIEEPIYVAMEPLAVWAENGEGTLRDLGARAGYLRSELALKRSVRILQQRAWKTARSADRRSFLNHPAFAVPAEMRARGLVKSHIRLGVGNVLSLTEKLRLAVRGSIIRLFGRPEPGLEPFINARGGRAA